MKIKIILIVLLLAVSAGLLTSCIPDNGGVDNMNYAAKAREIVDDFYINDGTDEDAAKIAYIGSHFYTILDILGIGHVENPDEVTADSPVSMTSDQIDIITTSIYSDLSLNFSTTETKTAKTYYQLEDLADILSSLGLQIEREAGSGPITADELKGVMDYYAELYENNDSVEREYFAGYLIGAISKNNPEVGNTVDQYSLDKLQLFLFLLDAFSLPADSPLAASVQTVSSKSAISISDNASGSHSNFESGGIKLKLRPGDPNIVTNKGNTVLPRSHWGAGAKKMKLKTVTTRRVVPLLDSVLKTYTYKFELTGPQNISCGIWKYKVHVTRSCTWSTPATSTIPTDEEELAPLPAPKDCRGVPQDVEGIDIKEGGKLKDHFISRCWDADAPLGVFRTKSDGRNCIDADCGKRCPPGEEKERTKGTTNINGYVTVYFSGIDKAVTHDNLSFYPLIPTTMVLDVTERVGDEIKCHEPKPE